MGFSGKVRCRINQAQPSEREYGDGGKHSTLRRLPANGGRREARSGWNAARRGSLPPDHLRESQTGKNAPPPPLYSFNLAKNGAGLILSLPLLGRGGAAREDES